MKLLKRGMAPATAVALAGAVVVLMACGGNGQKPAPTATGTAATSGAATVTPAAGTPANGTLTVQVGERGGQNYMQPTTLTVRAGQEFTITMKNVGVAVHNIHIFTRKGGDSIAATDPLAVPAGREGVLKAKIDRPGTYFVQCDFHPEVQGQVIVQ